MVRTLRKAFAPASIAVSWRTGFPTESDHDVAGVLNAVCHVREHVVDAAGLAMYTIKNIAGDELKLLVCCFEDANMSVMSVATDSIFGASFLKRLPRLIDDGHCGCAQFVNI